MFKHPVSPRAIAFLFAAFAVLGTTQAQAVQRTHVSAAHGSDSNTATNCTAAAPCRFFQAAMSVTDANGEVVVLDSGGYGAVTITQSVSLNAPAGVYAGISVFPNANGVTIATAGVNVVLRGLTINSQGGNNGINMSNGASLSVENCVVSNFVGNGIYVSTAANVRILDTLARDNGNGIVLQGGANAIIARTTVLGSTNQGVFVNGVVAGTTTAAISDSVFSGNYVGVEGYSGAAGANVRVSVSRSQISSNYYGVISYAVTAASTDVVTISGNTITQNILGIVQTGAATLVSLGNNTIEQSTSSDTQGTITPAGTK